MTLVAATESAFSFSCGDAALVGILHLPAAPRRRGVVVVVGGPQYRAGSHRQFTLLARRLAASGTPVLRFDYRGMGDSEGAARAFDDVAEDLRAAIDRFFTEVPDLREVVLWGLCDGATAAALYAAQDARVAGVVLLNPWVRTEQGAARATLRHYYGARLRDPALWRKLAGGHFDLGASLRSMLGLARNALAPPPQAQAAAGACGGALPERLHAGLAGFDGRILVLLAGADLTAQEFADTARAPHWRALLDAPRAECRTLAQADHTFSRREWHEQMVNWTQAWLDSW
ncbi:hydrolase 1, exosortase A system-associated [Massilia sp. G4R7]|uniref:Hydrolase 1, exosortase A system-associated n=1 Tax=Massilia phyllostachyos TaxID=2898585 RepID=A0ABS8QCE7_9BURK|nr:hydrolase 1, exosortase A system-associated [Massilia phyllostachyos]MCD2519404.1 hydrolase 1, exosortase A system-associated [Massilia phyllostachyos]